MAGTALPRRPASSRRPFLLVALTCSVLLLLVGCGGTVTPEEPSPTSSESGTGADETGTSAPTTSTGLPSTEEFTTPATEDTSTTEEGASAPDDVALELAGLPIGGFTEVDPTDATLRCAVINWSGPPDLPTDLTLEVTSLAVAPAGVYEWTDGGCSGAHPPCLDTPDVLDDAGQCEVSIRQIAASPDGFGEIAFQTGRVTCAADAESVCSSFQAVLTGADVDTVDWSDALTDWPTETTDPPTTTDVPPTTDPPTTTDAPTTDATPTETTSDVSETTG
ncbi:hypothetical protein [Ornithinimicrobium cavernae]|uniref:hypothetical protein n=1 Tax=Ornithinimicrobium cavernae TaxID=2666047 RepID=UPI00192A4BB5|nr:hypothetical protein [Ornithinimicrobium cavernae]